MTERSILVAKSEAGLPEGSCAEEWSGSEIRRGLERSQLGSENKGQQPQMARLRRVLPPGVLVDKPPYFSLNHVPGLLRINDEVITRNFLEGLRDVGVPE